MSNRSSIMMAIVTVGAMALSTAVVIGAFMVVDEQAAQVLRSGPRIVPAEKKAALPARSSRTAAGSGQSTNGAAPAGGPRSPAPTQAPPAGGGASANGAAPSPAPEQGSAAPAAPTPDTMVDSRHKRHAEGHHRGRRHGRHRARSSREPQQDGGEAEGQSASFFPFR